MGAGPDPGRVFAVTRPGRDPSPYFLTILLPYRPFGGRGSGFDRLSVAFLFRSCERFPPGGGRTQPGLGPVVLAA